MDFIWAPSDRYTANCGLSMARILDADDRLVTIEYWRPGNKRFEPKKATISVRCFTSQFGGWKLIAKGPD